MSAEELERFAKLIAEPLFTFVSDLKLPVGVKEVFGCDACGAVKIDPVVRSYADPDNDLCRACYNRLRKAATPAERVLEVEAAWKKANDDFAKEHEAEIIEVRHAQAVNDLIVSASFLAGSGLPPIIGPDMRRALKRKPPPREDEE